MNGRRAREARQGQTVTVIPDPGMVWVIAEHLAEHTPAELELVTVQLEGRRINARRLVECRDWLFGPWVSEAF